VQSRSLPHLLKKLTTSEVVNFKVHERQEIVDPINYPPVSARSPTCLRYRVAHTRIPEQRWVEVHERYSRGESLRVLGPDYGVSYEAIR
jgi:hypothetical protein